MLSSIHYLNDLHRCLAGQRASTVASDIPELGKADPAW